MANSKYPGIIDFPNGFQITANSPIDVRLVLSKEQMRTAEIDYAMPNDYFCLCIDDHKLYSFNANNTISAETGKFILADKEIQDVVLQLEDALEHEVQRALGAEDALHVYITEGLADVEAKIPEVIAATNEDIDALFDEE